VPSILLVLLIPSCHPPYLIPNLQDYIDSMEGATLSGRQCAAVVLDAAPRLAGSAAAAAAQQLEKQVVAA